jgi:hypothetical protein
MKRRLPLQTILPFIVLMILSHPAHAGQPANPCLGPKSLLSLLNRPTIADSACVVPPGDVVFEGGYENQISHNPQVQRSVVYPSGWLRFGLPGNWEIDISAPNYHSQTGSKASSGFGDVTIGAKYHIGQFGPVFLSADTKITLPSGAAAFSNGATDATVNGILDLSLTKHIGVGAQLGISTLTSQSAGAPVRRYTILQPDLVATYQLNIPLQFYAEIYRGSGFGGGAGDYSFDGGVQYLITRWWEVDAEAGTLLSGPRGARAHYFGLGLGIRL